MSEPGCPNQLNCLFQIGKTFFNKLPDAAEMEFIICCILWGQQESVILTADAELLSILLVLKAYLYYAGKDRKHAKNKYVYWNALHLHLRETNIA